MPGFFGDEPVLSGDEGDSISFLAFLVLGDSEYRSLVKCRGFLNEQAPPNSRCFVSYVPLFSVFISDTDRLSDA